MNKRICVQIQNKISMIKKYSEDKISNLQKISETVLVIHSKENSSEYKKQPICVPLWLLARYMSLIKKIIFFTKTA